MSEIPSRKKNRLTHYDYSLPGYYFVTICTKDRKEYFGKIINDQMILNQYGNILAQQINDLENNCPYVILDEWIIMPNHLHLILVVKEDRSSPVPTGRSNSLLSKAIAILKTKSSSDIRLNGLKNFQWQRSFYDHIIRDDKSLYEIRVYIRNNPMNWSLDRNNINLQF